MLPVKALRLQLGTTLAADVPTLAPVVANEIVLIAAPFTPNEDLAIGDLTLATFTGSAPKAGAAGAQQVAIDPLTEQQRIIIIPPLGGYIFVCTVAPSAPETIYGYALTDTAGAALLGTSAFPAPIAISEVGHFVDCGEINLVFVVQPMS